MTDKIVSSHQDGVAHIQFNNPERRNAVSLEMWQAVGRALDGFAADQRVRVVVLSGAGDKAFVSGADISKFEQERSSAEAIAHYNAITADVFAKLADFAKPTIAQITRQLRRRRRGARGVLRSAHLRRGLALWHPGRQARPWLRLCRRQPPGPAGRPVVRQGDFFHRPPVLIGRGA